MESVTNTEAQPMEMMQAAETVAVPMENDGAKDADTVMETESPPAQKTWLGKIFKWSVPVPVAQAKPGTEQGLLSPPGGWLWAMVCCLLSINLILQFSIPSWILFLSGSVSFSEMKEKSMLDSFLLSPLLFILSVMNMILWEFWCFLWKSGGNLWESLGWCKSKQSPPLVSMPSGSLI